MGGKSAEGYKTWREKHRGTEKFTRYRKNSKLRERYGITLEQYEEMHQAQSGACAICKQTVKRLCVDHNHTTGEVRGLLCQNCNSAIGQLREDPTLFANAIEYLRR